MTALSRPRTHGPQSHRKVQWVSLMFLVSSSQKVLRGRLHHRWGRLGASLSPRSPQRSSESSEVLGGAGQSPQTSSQPFWSGAVSGSAVTEPPLLAAIELMAACTRKCSRLIML